MQEEVEAICGELQVWSMLSDLDRQLCPANFCELRYVMDSSKCLVNLLIHHVYNLKATVRKAQQRDLHARMSPRVSSPILAS